jgi:quercetin 2,3-dioxygenase
LTQHIFNAPEVMMGPHKLRQAIPLPELEQISPFILLHHFDFTIEPGNNSFNVPAHPHRGFCPITFMFDGSVMHEDSLGNKKEIHSNEVQWINAARGIIHSETMSPEFVEKGGRFQGIQLWINLLAAEKMLEPTYQPITSAELIFLGKEGVEVRLISGMLEGKQGPALSANTTAMIRIQANQDYTFELDKTEHVLLYILEGEITFDNEQAAGQHQLVLMEKDCSKFSIHSVKDSKILLMAGNPIDEPLVTHGPFVMNSQTEIMEAMRDYQQGKMGFLY